MENHWKWFTGSSHFSQDIQSKVNVWVALHVQRESNGGIPWVRTHTHTHTPVQGLLLRHTTNGPHLRTLAEIVRIRSLVIRCNWCNYMYKYCMWSDSPKSHASSPLGLNKAPSDFLRTTQCAARICRCITAVTATSCRCHSNRSPGLKFAEGSASKEFGPKTQRGFELLMLMLPRLVCTNNSRSPISIVSRVEVMPTAALGTVSLSSHLKPSFALCKSKRLSVPRSARGLQDTRHQSWQAKGPNKGQVPPHAARQAA